MYIRGLDIRLTARYGLAILRIVLGIAMLVHGWSKLSGGVDNVAGFFGGMLGIPAPGLMAWVVTIVELVGGILLVVGFLTQIAGILIALDMLGAILLRIPAQGRSLHRERRHHLGERGGLRRRGPLHRPGRAGRLVGR